MDNEYMTVREVAEYLSVTTFAIYQWLTLGKLKGYKAGEAWRIRKEDVEKFLKPNKVS